MSVLCSPFCVPDFFYNPFLTGAVDKYIASQSDLLAHPSLRLRYRATHLFAKNDYQSFSKRPLLRCPEIRSVAVHFPTAAPIDFRFICHRQRSNKLPSSASSPTYPMVKQKAHTYRIGFSFYRGSRT